MPQASRPLSRWLNTASLAGCLALAGCLFPGSAGGEERPNILLIMADDIGIDGISGYGSDSYQTPRLDQLAEEGLRFTHAYSQPLCTPTRIEIMTGRDNHRNWLYFGILDPRERTFGHLLKDAGYRTAIAGKWQLQSYDPPDFPHADRRRGTGMKVSEAGFERWSLYHSWHTEAKGSRYADPSFDRDGDLQGPLVGQYGPDTSVRFLLDFIEAHREEPFFAYFPMALPHWPMVPTPQSEAWKDPTRRLEESIDYFPDMVMAMDRIVGELVDGIDALGLGKRTLILFYSDNGTDARITSQFRGKTVPGGKASPLQTGIRVPLIARWTGTLPGNETCDDLIDASDFLPTLAELAGTAVPEDWQTDGLSFAPRLRGRLDGSKRDACFFWYDPRPGWDKERFTRHIFALDHDYKLFQDGRLFDIAGDGLREEPLDPTQLSAEAKTARERLQQVIIQHMTEPISDAARIEVDAFGNPVN